MKRLLVGLGRGGRLPHLTAKHGIIVDFQTCRCHLIVNDTLLTLIWLPCILLVNGLNWDIIQGLQVRHILDNQVDIFLGKQADLQVA